MACSRNSCYCQSYIQSTSKWSKDRCNSCNHPKKEHKQVHGTSTGRPSSKSVITQSTINNNISGWNSSTAASTTNIASNRGCCNHAGCYCKAYIVSTSKWSQDKCNFCNHAANLHQRTNNNSTIRAPSKSVSYQSKQPASSLASAKNTNQPRFGSGTTPSNFVVGDKISALYEDKWHKAQVINVRNHEIEIIYDDWLDSNEWINKNSKRLKKPSSKKVIAPSYNQPNHQHQSTKINYQATRTTSKSVTNPMNHNNAANVTNVASLTEAVQIGLRGTAKFVSGIPSTKEMMVIMGKEPQIDCNRSGCYCTLFVVPTSKWSKKDLCNTCNHPWQQHKSTNWKMKQVVKETKEALPTFSVPISSGECGICYLNKSNIRSLSICGHKICKECLKQYIMKTASNKLNISCPFCTNKLDHNKDVKSVFTSKEFCEIFLIPNLKQCLTPNCKNKISLFGTSVASLLGTSSRLDCNKCKRSWCIDCKVPWHENMDCKTYKETDMNELKTKEMLNKENEQGITKPCPVCNEYVNKNGGCNHMTCVCGTHWCWICGQPYPYSTIYSHIGTHR